MQSIYEQVVGSSSDESGGMEEDNQPTRQRTWERSAMHHHELVSTRSSNLDYKLSIKIHWADNKATLAPTIKLKSHTCMVAIAILLLWYCGRLGSCPRQLSQFSNSRCWWFINIPSLCWWHMCCFIRSCHNEWLPGACCQRLPGMQCLGFRINWTTLAYADRHDVCLSFPSFDSGCYTVQMIYSNCYKFKYQLGWFNLNFWHGDKA